jgi:glycosyltransferase involved in cell wall biosynthesis
MTEAMACYTPVIATLTDGSAAQLGSGSEWVVPQHNEADVLQLLPQKIQQLLSLPDSDYAALQQSGYHYARRCLVDDVAVQIQQLYQDLSPAQKR